MITLKNLALRKPYTTGSWARLLILFIVGAGILNACESIGKPDAAQSTNQIVVRDATGFMNAIEAVADSALPCVVQIEVSGSALEQVSPDGSSALLQGISKVPMHGLGSGILVNREGHIITNNHVVENADSIVVHFYDGTERAAVLIGSDRFTDIAVIKVEGTGLARAARMGDSDALRVGEWVVAIGSPRGLDWTVTQGIVSATHRVRFNSRAQAGVEDFIQTDTAINPGNSGGPLLNLKGEVIGMNSLIMSQNQGSEGLGFAIPSNLVKKVVNALIRDGKVTRGDLGIEALDINDSIRRGLKLPPDTRGVVVTQAVPLGPAAEAGLTVGDVIASFQQSPVLSSAQLNKFTAAASPGTSVALGIIRKGARSTLRLSVVDQLGLMTKRAESPGYGLLGIRVEPVSSSVAASVGLNGTSGVLVVEVVPGSPADNVSIAKGDIIFRVDGASVGDQEEFRQRVGEAIQAGNVVVLLRDGPTGRTGFMVIPIR